jgi:3-oxoacyl-[acyl-carrier protein] reductase
MIKTIRYIFNKLLKIEKVVKLNISYVNPSERFAGKSVLVTGGSSGIGYAVAETFLREGAEVIICARNRDKLEDAASRLKSSRIKTMVFDVSDVAQMKDHIHIASKLNNGIDIFVNCAGVSSFKGGDDTEQMYDHICDINTKGLYFANKYEGDYFIENQRQGKIINITSKAGERIGFDPYILSKWGANSITKGNARRLAPYHVNVNGVAPGRVPTNITAELQSHLDSLMDGNAYTPQHLTGRFTMPNEVAAAVAFLASDVANNIVGQVLVIDGGSYQ